MLYDIGIFCVIIGAVIGVISIMFSLSKIRTLKAIALLLISSGILVSLGTTFEVLQPPSSKEQGNKESPVNE